MLLLDFYSAPQVLKGYKIMFGRSDVYGPHLKLIINGEKSKVDGSKGACTQNSTLKESFKIGGLLRLLKY